MPRPAAPKADKLRAVAESLGWTVRVAQGDVFRGFAARAELPVAMFVARRGEEVVTITWIDEVATGPIGWYVTPDELTPLRNRSEARQRLEAPPTDPYLLSAFDLRLRLGRD